MRKCEKLAVPPELYGVYSEDDVGNLRATFSAYDQDGSGTIDKDELKKVGGWR